MLEYCDVLFFFNDTATTEIYTLSLHDALPICRDLPAGERADAGNDARPRGRAAPERTIAGADHGEHRGDQAVHHRDRKSTRLNSSHANISYAVFCLKKKKTRQANMINDFITKQ